MWNELLIDPDGSIYSCCHSSPALLGNIYDDKLCDVCNGETIQKMRKHSLEGKLHCYEKCTLFDKKASQECVQHHDVFADFQDYEKLLIRVGTRCNIRCVMCGSAQNKGNVLDFDKIKDNLTIDPFEKIVLTGGEPLAMPSAKRIFDHVAEAGKQVSMMSNGVLINDEWAEKIATHSRFIYISLNAASKETHEMINVGSNWEKVLANIQRVRKARSRLGTNVSIHGHMTIVHSGDCSNVHEIGDFIRNFRSFGCDVISFGYTRKIPGLFKENPDLFEKTKADVADAIESCGGKIAPLRLKLLKLW